MRQSGASQSSDYGHQGDKASNLNVFTVNTRQMFENSEVLNLIQTLSDVNMYHNIVALVIHTSFMYLHQFKIKFKDSSTFILYNHYSFKKSRPKCSLILFE